MCFDELLTDGLFVLDDGGVELWSCERTPGCLAIRQQKVWGPGEPSYDGSFHPYYLFKNDIVHTGFNEVLLMADCNASVFVVTRFKTFWAS
jgi:hypothetical protein